MSEHPTGYTVPTEFPAHVRTEQERNAYLHGHVTGYNDAGIGNTGHGTEPPNRYAADDVWFEGWDNGVRAYPSA